VFSRPFPSVSSVATGREDQLDRAVRAKRFIARVCDLAREHAIRAAVMHLSSRSLRMSDHLRPWSFLRSIETTPPSAVVASR
jgi:hypothetical protein